MRTSTLVVCVLAASQLGASECGGGPVLRDPGFELWCGETLCAWKVERGEIQRAPTWHSSDSGIAFVGDDVAISQLSPVNSTDGSCIQFDLVANVADTAEMFLDIDVEGDGTVERSERIPTSAWKPLTYLLRFASPFDGVRFALVKRGPGTAVLAQIEADLVASSECAGLTPIEAAPRPNGARCNIGLITLEGDGNEQCASGRCASHQCMGCDLDDATTCPAAAGEVCGLGDPTSPLLAVPTQCVAAAARELAEQCSTTA
nr:hypothetical protein [Deltaproteobacteria bacterium]